MAFGEEGGAGVQGPAEAVTRQVVLDALTAAVQRVPCAADDVERIQSATASGSSSAAAVVNQVNLFIATTSPQSRRR